MEQGLDVYRRPFDPAFPGVCMDETSRQLISETRGPVPADLGRPTRHDYEYRRCGTCNVFMAAEPLAGQRMTKVTQRRTKPTGRASLPTSPSDTRAPSGALW